jgi:hypothetical protein
MKYLSPNRSEGVSSGFSPNSAGNQAFYARVVRVITSELDAGYNENGGLKSINGIYCSSIESTTGQSDQGEPSTFFAYQSNLNFLHVPIVGEIVKVETIPSVDFSTLTLPKVFYYTAVVNFWNHPKDSLYYDLYKPVKQDQFHQGFNINPISSSEGDSMFQGRYGQLIKYSTDIVNRSPRIYISSGRLYQDPAYKVVGEDVNKDYNSIELITNGLSGIKSSNLFKKSHRKDQTPKSTDTYTGEQIVANSGRIVFNSKDDSVLISSKKSVATTASTINQEATKEVCLEAPKIFLGADSMNTKTPEPVVLGNKLEGLLIEIIDQLIGISESLATAATVSGQQLPLVNQNGIKTSIILKSIKSRLNPKGTSEYKSKKTFVE